MDMNKHKEWFDEYVRKMRLKMKGDVSLIDVKHTHSLRVLRNAEIINTQIVPPGRDDLASACLLAALYHDIGRFEQVLRWGTYKDSLSTDHGLLGVRVLKAERPLYDEPPAIRAAVTAAVGMHNRFSLPSGLSADLALITNVVRDADKLDIIRVMANHMLDENPDHEHNGIVLNVLDDPGVYSQAVINDALSGRTASYNDLSSVNDFKVLLGTWLYGMAFGCSRHIMKQAGYLRKVLESLPPEGPFGAVRAHLLSGLEAVCA